MGAIVKRSATWVGAALRDAATATPAIPRRAQAPFCSFEAWQEHALLGMTGRFDRYGTPDQKTGYALMPTDRQG
jgi:hypothetical protein